MILFKIVLIIIVVWSIISMMRDLVDDYNLHINSSAFVFNIEKTPDGDYVLRILIILIAIGIIRLI